MVFTCDTMPNMKISIEDGRTRLQYSLNIKNSMARYLKPGRIFRSDTRVIYALSKEIHFTSKKHIMANYNILKNTAMIDCRNAKVKVLKEEIIQLSLNF